MLVYHSGLRRPELRIMPFPESLMMTFEDVGPYGENEQRLLFDDLLRERGSDLKVPHPSKVRVTLKRMGGADA